MESRTLPSVPIEREHLTNVTEADVCVIGGGLAGLATALGLAERGLSVVVLEQDRVGAAASGRNGGFAMAGFALYDSDLLEEASSRARARSLYALTLDALRILRERINVYKIDCDVQDVGSVTLSLFADGQVLNA